jgi:2-C-methyl-D-erythritol 2,4-cyclodiphosphate synthase
MFRVGLGFDNHRLVPGRKLLIGGVEVPSPVGEEAHSDGDVLIHAACDAIYGALGRGDIGEHFPDSDPRWRGQASSLFLEDAARLAAGDGYRLSNLDGTVFLEKVRLSPHKQAIEDSLRRILGAVWDVPAGAINVKAKTMERCDSVGRGEAIAAQVAVLLERKE